MERVFRAVKEYAAALMLLVSLLVLGYDRMTATKIDAAKMSEYQVLQDTRIALLEQDRKDAPNRREMDDVKSRLQRIEDKLDMALDGRLKR